MPTHTLLSDLNTKTHIFTTDGIRQYKKAKKSLQLNNLLDALECYKQNKHLGVHKSITDRITNYITLLLVSSVGECTLWNGIHQYNRIFGTRLLSNDIEDIMSYIMYDKIVHQSAESFKTFVNLIKDKLLALPKDTGLSPKSPKSLECKKNQEICLELCKMLLIKTSPTPRRVQSMPPPPPRPYSQSTEAHPDPRGLRLLPPLPSPKPPSPSVKKSPSPSPKSPSHSSPMSGQLYFGIDGKKKALYDVLKENEKKFEEEEADAINTLAGLAKKPRIHGGAKKPKPKRKTTLQKKISK